MRGRCQTNIVFHQLKHIVQVFLTIIIFAAMVGFIMFSFTQQVGAQAVSPNGRYGKCGPYYLWYQVSPDSYASDYVDLCGITFDISDVVDDFNFVYFTDTTSSQRAWLDKNRDGISDQYFFRRTEDQILEWKPDMGCVRIDLRDCWGAMFNPNCGYAMIHIQPKPGVRSGSARIPVKAIKKCSPNGVDCSETTTISHEYSDCVAQALPDFIVQKKVDQVFGGYKADFKYTITVQNIGSNKGSTMVTDTFTGGTNGGTLELAELKIEQCPSHARCTISSITNETIQISLVGLGVGNVVTITYSRKGNAADISKGDISYFTNTATLPNGSSSQVTVGVQGSGEFPGPRPERPRQP
jgi:hypothetical protein